METEVKRIYLDTNVNIKKNKTKSPFDIPGIKTKATTQDILDAVRESRID